MTIHALLISQYKAAQLAYGENFDGRHWTLCGSRESIKYTVHSTYVAFSCDLLSWESNDNPFEGMPKKVRQPNKCLFR